LRFASAAMAGTTAAAQILLVKNTPENKQGFALGVLSTAIWGGSMLGNVVGGIIVHYYGYSFTFIACGVMYFLAGIAVLPAREDFTPLPRQVKKQSRRLAMPQFTQAVWMLLALMMLTGLVRYVEVPYLAMLVEAVTGPEKAAYWTGIISAFASVAAMASGAIFGYLSDRVKGEKLLLPALAVTSLTLLLQGAATTLLAFGSGRVILALAGGGIQPVIQKALAGVTPKSKRGTVFGLSSTFNGLGIIGAATCAGLVIYLWNTRAVFYVAAVLTLLLIPIALFLLKKVFNSPFYRANRGK
jgi:DHA1 family multidrug resistance protein-like MFS transporter